MNLEHLKLFIHVAQEKSISKAAVRVKLSQSALSQSMITFQREMGVELYRRSSRGIVLSTAGELLYNDSLGIIKYEERIQEQLYRLRNNELSGNIRVVCSPSISGQWVLPFINRFCTLHPSVSLDLTFHTKNITLNYTDVYIAPFYSENDQLIQTFFLTSPLSFYASQAYLDKFGMPENFSDLNHHRFIMLKENIGNPVNEPNLLEILGQEDYESSRRFSFKTNTLDSAITLTKMGQGICEIPQEFAALNPELIPVLSNYVSANIDIYLNSLKSKETVLAVKTFKDFMEAKTDDNKKKDQAKNNNEKQS